MASNQNQSFQSILQDKPRFSVFPLQRPLIWKEYKNQQSLAWVSEEVVFSRDWNDWINLTPEEQKFLKFQLGFFAVGDGYIIENLISQFTEEVDCLEVQYTYAHQAVIEQIHAEVYGRTILAYIKDEKERNELLAKSCELPTIKKKTNWIKKWMNADNGSFGERLFAFAIVEGVFFSGAFCAIYYFKERGVLPGLCHANDLIARDEGMHCDFAAFLNQYLAPYERCTQEKAYDIIKGAVEIEDYFINKAMPCSLIGMNPELMSEYIRFVADRLLVQFGHKKLYNAKCPFPYMERLGLRGKSNFFEKEVGDYGKAMVGLADEDNEFALTDDF